ncbi:erythroblast NAD(P)(+)--arginine ADP-ribosyltransferase-like [Poecile atricapillus]|uniref:erythroblast NAD(P)(+)--arginine ADP-ribosyltransferase-like n=1 Tax=Poecile atricapillus TaxID=48891 RepID=UPI0027383250|nr:erythroblast NAD(P)(+)--arginine ADP-ribosyltransferase-like [Poecile atricapillus]
MELLSPLLVLLAGTVASSIHLHWWERGGTTKEIALDMAPNSFDDRYLRCHFKMLRALPALNRTEFVPYGDYAEAWARAMATWASRAHTESPLQLELAIALLAYTMEEGLYLEFNRAVRTAGRSRREYLDTFPFKVLHYLLTEALSELRGAQSHPRCLHVYRGVDGIRFTAGLGRIVRFGQFASTSLLQNVSESYGITTTFEVDTCHGADIRDFSNYPEEQEVLIPPFETFKVTNITHQGDDIYIQLRSHGVHSKYNCALFQGRSVPRDPPGLTGLLLAALAVVTGTP